jgi:type I restriction enzyme S subunit
MSNWKEEILSEHIGLRHGYQFRETDFTEHGIQVIKIGNVTSDGLSLTSNVSYVSAERQKEFESIIIRDGDILMSLTGNIGRVVEVNNLGNRILFQNYRVGVFYPLKDNITKPFIKWVLSSDETLRQLNRNANQSAQANFGKQDLDKLKFKIPSITEQIKISKILNTTDTVIEKTQAAIAKYKAIKHGMLHDLFTRGIDLKNGKLRPKQQDAPEFYKESKFGWIPKEWAEGVLGELVEIEMGQSPDSIYYNTSNNGFPLIQGNADIKDRKSIQRIWTTHLTKIVESGDIIMTVRAPVGLIGIASEKSCAGRGICAFQKPSLNKEYLFYLLIFHENNWGQFEQGSTFTAVGSAEVFNYPLVFASSLDEQKLISKKLAMIDKKIQTEESYLIKLQQIKSGLMYELLTGAKLVVSNTELETETSN